MSITIKLIILMSMFFCHIVDDYYLQGILSQMKQRRWWENNAPNELYCKDYLMALIEHAFSWAFVISIPLLFVAIVTENGNILKWLLIGYFINTIIHAYVDNLKANYGKINLIQDQLIHFLQIITLWLLTL